MPVRRWFNQLTLTQQWIAVTLLTVVPLLVALGYAAWSLALQSEQQRDLLARMDNLNKMDAFIQRQLASMERVSRQFMLIGDSRFAELYRHRLEALADYRINLVVTLPSGREQSKLTELLQLASQIGVELYQRPAQVDGNKIDRLWAQINAEREELSSLIERFGEESTAAGERRLQQVQQRLALIGAGTVLATLVLISISSIAVTKPVRRLASAIDRMGHQEWEQAVEIDGPRDFIALGNSLEWMRLQLLAADKQKQAFLHHITHELKTPLAAIMEAESLLRDQVPGPLTQEQFGVLSILHHNARSLQSLIQQLLNYNAIKHSHALELSPVNIRQLCERIRQQLDQANTENKQVHYEFKGEWNSIPCDRQCLDMILSNLLSNAHRSVGPEGRITVDWGRDRHQWWLTVEDNGSGIAADEQDNIFKPFYQGRNTKRGPLKGSGMGLAIVRECVLRLNGSIEMSSIPDQATVFTLRFPLGDQNYHEAA
ncbi:HAMP domain-containing sensor histidine kinase [Gilvimarinus sp. F26214L]|uniref:HAMP domain-containing sensor histidine kinase n=1 Tax=Gilvimarinus sp. DZF01 TaxID=3461371 RepID=UPI004045B6A9